MVGLLKAADIKVEDFSRGMKQRLHIARALVNDPELLFMDEPTIGLDPEISRSVRSMIRDLSGSGKTIILTTHYMYEAEELCDAWSSCPGRIVGRGTVGEKRTVLRLSVIHMSPTATLPKRSRIRFRSGHDRGFKQDARQI